MAGTSLEEYNKVSIVTRRVKGESTKLPVPFPEMTKDYNSGMGGVDPLNQNHLVGVITLDYFLI